MPLLKNIERTLIHWYVGGGLEGLRVGYAFVHKLEELLTERMSGPWNTLITITYHTVWISSPLNYWLNVFEAAQLTQQVNIPPSAQILSWHDDTSSRECFPRLEVHSTCNYRNCPFLFVLVHISADPGDHGISSPTFTHAPRIRVLFSWYFFKGGSYWATWCLSMCSSTLCSETFAKCTQSDLTLYT